MSAQFFHHTPKKEVPKKARRAFERLKPDQSLLSTILSWLAKAKLSKQWQCGEFIPLPATFLSERYWEGDPPPIAAHKNDSVGLNCTEPASSYICDSCEDTGRLIVLFKKNDHASGESVGCAPWSPMREKLMAVKDEEARLFRCCCESGKNYSLLEIWCA